MCMRMAIQNIEITSRLYNQGKIPRDPAFSSIDVDIFHLSCTYSTGDKLPEQTTTDPLAP